MVTGLAQGAGHAGEVANAGADGLPALDRAGAAVLAGVGRAGIGFGLADERVGRGLLVALGARVAGGALVADLALGAGRAGKVADAGADGLAALVRASAAVLAGVGIAGISLGLADERLGRGLDIALGARVAGGALVARLAVGAGRAGEVANAGADRLGALGGALAAVLAGVGIAGIVFELADQRLGRGGDIAFGAVVALRPGVAARARADRRAGRGVGGAGAVAAAVLGRAGVDDAVVADEDVAVSAGVAAHADPGQLTGADRRARGVRAGAVTAAGVRLARSGPGAADARVALETRLAGAAARALFALGVGAAGDAIALVLFAPASGGHQGRRDHRQ